MIRALRFVALAALALCVSAPVFAQTPREVYTLATGNVAGSDQGGTFVASARTKVYGGTYVLSQACSAYGTVTFRYLGPDGSTMLTLTTKTAADSGGGTFLSLGSAAQVGVTLAGTTGCEIDLMRAPQQ